MKSEHHAPVTPTRNPAPRWDRQGQAALWILSDPIFAGRVHFAIDSDAHTIDFDALLAKCWSAGERLLIRAANDLYNGDRTASLDDLTTVLDDRNLRVVIGAIAIRRGWGEWH